MYVDWRHVLSVAERCLSVLVCVVVVNTLVTQGLQALLRDIVRLLRKLPFVNSILGMILDGEVKGALRLFANGNDGSNTKNQTTYESLAIPAAGLPAKKVLDIMKKLHEHETATEEGKAFAYTYTSDADMPELSNVLQDAFSIFSEKMGTKQHNKLLDDVWRVYMHTNALNPMLIPSLRKLETEVVSMTAWMLHGDSDSAGSLTSGGTESILMAVKTYRDRARKLCPGITRPNMVVPISIHPAFEKAGHYFDVELIHVPLAADFRVDMAAFKKAVNRNTILLVGSAPQYCHGVVDPIEEMSAFALTKGLPLHVDGCYGGFMLPWLEKIGIDVPLWDFRVAGVSSISADVHKYGYASKGCSIILYRNAELRSFQYFAYADWPGGLFGSPSMAGSRPGGMVASAWAAMVSVGQDGYMKLAGALMDTTLKIVNGVAKIDGLTTVGVSPPHMTAVAIASTDPMVDILAVADVMEESGWKMERQQLPDSLHMSILPQHAKVCKQLLLDLAAAVVKVRANKKAGVVHKGSAGVYGMVAAIPDKEIVNDFILKLFGSLFTPELGGTGEKAAIVDQFAGRR